VKRKTAEDKEKKPFYIPHLYLRFPFELSTAEHTAGARRTQEQPWALQSPAFLLSSLELRNGEFLWVSHRHTSFPLSLFLSLSYRSLSLWSMTRARGGDALEDRY
jgi:hypothetical protein